MMNKKDVKPEICEQKDVEQLTDRELKKLLAEKKVFYAARNAEVQTYYGTSAVVFGTATTE